MERKRGGLLEPRRFHDDEEISSFFPSTRRVVREGVRKSPLEREGNPYPLY